MHGLMAQVLNYAGRPKEAVEYAKFEMRHDPRQVHSGLFQLGKAYFSMGKLEQAATCFERSLTHNPDEPFVYTYLAATYAHLDREKEAREALNNFYNQLEWKPTLGVMMYWNPFKDSEVAERFAEGVLKAGIRGEPSGYYKILEENRLSGEEIRKLVFGREFLTSCKLVNPLFGNRNKDGTIMYRGEAVGKSRIDGDLLCDKWDSRFDGLEYCGTVFRKSESTSDAGDEYLYVNDFQFCELISVE
jgi:adenylate cyclase